MIRRISFILVDQFVAKKAAHGAVLGFERVLGRERDASLLIVAGWAPLVCPHLAAGLLHNLVEGAMFVVVGDLLGLFFTGDGPEDAENDHNNKDEYPVFFADTHKKPP